MKGRELLDSLDEKTYKKLLQRIDKVVTKEMTRDAKTLNGMKLK